MKKRVKKGNKKLIISIIIIAIVVITGFLIWNYAIAEKPLFSPTYYIDASSGTPGTPVELPGTSDLVIPVFGISGTMHIDNIVKLPASCTNVESDRGLKIYTEGNLFGHSMLTDTCNGDVLNEWVCVENHPGLKSALLNNPDAVANGLTPSITAMKLSGQCNPSINSGCSNGKCIQKPGTCKFIKSWGTELNPLSISSTNNSVYVIKRTAGENQILNYDDEGNFIGIISRKGSGNTCGNGETGNVACDLCDRNAISNWLVSNKGTWVRCYIEFIGGLAADEQGNVFNTVSVSYRRADTGQNILNHNWKVYIMNGNENQWKIYSNNPDNPTPTPEFLAVDDNYLYVSMTDGKIIKYDKNTKEKVLEWGAERGKDIAVSLTNLYLSSSGEQGKIKSYSKATGALVKNIGQSGTNAGEFRNNNKIGAVSAGSLGLFVADGNDGKTNTYENHRFQRFTSSLTSANDLNFIGAHYNGEWYSTGIVGGNYGNNDGYFMNPIDVSVSQDNSVYVVDKGDNTARIQKFRCA